MIVLAWVLYWIGDIISITFMRFGLGYPIYNKVMNWSLKFDKNDVIWKKVK